MAFLEKRKLKNRDSYRIVWYNPPSIRHTYKVGCVPKRIADQQLVRVESLLAEGKDPNAERAKRQSSFLLSSFLLSSLVNAFVEWAGPRLRPRTIEMYQSVVSSLIRQMGDLPPGDLTAERVEAYLSEMAARGLSATYINIHLRTLKALFRWAVEVTALLKIHPFTRVKPHATGVENGRSRISFLTSEQVAALFKAVSDEPDLLNLIQFYVWTGARRNEAFELTWGDVDFMGELVWLGDARSKTKRRRSVPMSARLRTMLVKIWAESAAKDGKDHVFAWASRQPNALSHRMIRLRKRVPGIPDDFSLHVLRHTFASHLIMSAVDLTTVASMLGHSTTKTTEIYSHLLPDHRKAAIANLPF